MRSCFCFLLLCGLSFGLKAQSIIHGKVIDGATSQGVSHASVKLYRVDKLVKSAFSDNEGQYCLSLDSSQILDSMKIWISGYSIGIIQKIAISKGQNVEMSVTLPKIVFLPCPDLSNIELSPTMHTDYNGENIRRSAAMGD